MTNCTTSPPSNSRPKTQHRSISSFGFWQSKELLLFLHMCWMVLFVLTNHLLDFGRCLDEKRKLSNKEKKARDFGQKEEMRREGTNRQMMALLHLVPLNATDDMILVPKRYDIQHVVQVFSVSALFLLILQNQTNDIHTKITTPLAQQTRRCNTTEVCTKNTAQ